ncbi:MAG: hypothetical protein OEY38_00145 [Gammaproteobacteria bacterium]|nr:hypothetical protein [Gammaproteobacteria bacterium]
MILYSVDGKNIDSNALTFSQFSFGKGDGFETFRYEIKFAKGVFIEKLTPLYNDGVEELREDDEIAGDFEPPYPGATDYPLLSEFIDIEGASLFEYLYAYHKFDILDIALDEDNDVANYVINSIDSIEKVGEDIIVKGTAIKR